MNLILVVIFLPVVFGHNLNAEIATERERHDEHH